MKLLNSKDKKKIIEKLNESFGINEIPFHLIMFGTEKIRAFSGDIDKETLCILDRELRVENAGLYFMKEEDDGVRLTFDGVGLLKDSITKNIFEINEEQFKEWMSGADLAIKTNRGFKILKYKNEFVGCGKSTGEKITNFVPRERRVR